MTTTITGSGGVSKVQTGAIEHGDLPSGSVLQVVNAVYTTFTTTSSGSFVDTGLTATITPKSTSSKIFVIISAGMGNTSAAANNNVQITRDSTSVATFSRVSFSAGGHMMAQNSSTDLDSPSTTSAVTYKLQFKTDTGTFRFCGSSSGTPSARITLMEIAG
jgi:hypothetical protein